MEYTGENNLKTMKLACNYNNWLIRMIAKEIRQKDNKVLDFGSGDGFFAENIGKKTFKDILCLEPSSNMQKYYGQKKIYGDLTEIENNSLDFIYSMNVLEHIENDKAIIDEFYRVLQKEGIVYLYLPACMYLWSSLDDLVGHYRRYNISMLRKLFNSKQWNIENLRYADFLGFFVTILFKIVGNKKGNISPRALFIFDRFVFPMSLLMDKLTFGKLLGKNILIKVTKK